MVKLYAAIFGAVVTGILLLFLLVGWPVSGWLAASSLMTAVHARNMTAVVHRMDAQRLRATAADDWPMLVPANLKLPGLGSVGEELRTAINLGLRNVEAETPAMAEMLVNLLEGRGLVSGRVASMVPVNWQPKRTPTFAYSFWNSSDAYLLNVNFTETGEQITVTLERRGWFTWRIVRVQPNGTSILWPFKIPR